jgi:Zn-finger nucleic acid-binding protein
MDLVSRAGESGAECPSCGGVFYDTDTLRMLLNQNATKPVVVAPQDPSQDEPTQYLRCPLCPEMMNRHTFGASSGVFIDVCKQDGVWFDDGELARSINGRGGSATAPVVEHLIKTFG